MSNNGEDQLQELLSQSKFLQARMRLVRARTLWDWLTTVWWRKADAFYAPEYGWLSITLERRTVHESWMLVPKGDGTLQKKAPELGAPPSTAELRYSTDWLGRPCLKGTVSSTTHTWRVRVWRSWW